MQAKITSTMLVAFQQLPAIAFLLLLLSACAKKQAAEVEAPAPVQVTSVSQATIRRIVNGDGVLFPQDQANVIPNITAPVQKFYVRRGDHVKQGQLLAELENRGLVAAGDGSQDRHRSSRIQFTRHRRRDHSGLSGEGANGSRGRPAGAGRRQEGAG